MDVMRAVGNKARGGSKSFDIEVLEQSVRRFAFGGSEVRFQLLDL